MLNENEKRWLDSLDKAIASIYNFDGLTLDGKNHLAYSLLQSHCLGDVKLTNFKLAIRIREYYQDQEGN